MFRFFLFLLVASLLATAGSYYWKTYHPEGPMVTVNAGSKSAAPGTTEDEVSASGTNRSLGDRSLKVTLPSDMQHLASLVSFISSLLSGLGAMISAYFSWAHYRASRVAVRSED